MRAQILNDSSSTLLSMAYGKYCMHGARSGHPERVDGIK